MTKTAELPIPATDELENLSAGPLLTPIPVIKPKRARLLELTQANGSSVTPKEINAQLDRVLRDYDAVSYTHLDVYKRQTSLWWIHEFAPAVAEATADLGAS